MDGQPVDPGEELSGVTILPGTIKWLNCPRQLKFMPGA